MLLFAVELLVLTTTLGQQAAVALEEEKKWSQYHILESTPSELASLEAIRRLPLRRFEMTHDTVAGRVQYGVLAKDASEILAKVHGEAVTRDEPVPGAKNGMTRAVVNEKVLFYHGIAALRAVAAKLREFPTVVGRGFEGIEKLETAVQDLDLEKDWRSAAQLEKALKLAEARTMTANAELLSEQQDGDRRLKELAFSFSQRNATALFKNDLEMQRIAYHQDLRRLKMENLTMEEQASGRRINQVHRATMLERFDDEYNLAAAREERKTATAVEVAKEKERQKAETERRNEDVRLRHIAARGEALRQNVLEAIDAIAAEIAAFSTSLRSKPQRAQRFFLSIAAIVAGYFFTRETAILARKLITQYLMRPALVRESNFTPVTFFFWFFVLLFKRRRRRQHDDDMTKDQGSSSLLGKDIILSQQLGDRLERLSSSIRGSRQLGAPLRHVLFHGPPGTGKTMLARRLATVSGLDWAIMSGGDVGPLGSAATTELHKLLNWARTSPRGLLLFVDEADAALADRRRPDISEHAVSALNAFLFHTSDPSYSLMLVLATNRPSDLDTAVLDRIDDVIEVPLPDANARRNLVHLYFHQCFDDSDQIISTFRRLAQRFLSRVADQRPKVASDFNKTKNLEALVPLTRGSSGREISKLLLSVQGTVFSQSAIDGRLELTNTLWHQAITWKLHEVKPTGVSRTIDDPKNLPPASSLTTHL